MKKTTGIALLSAAALLAPALATAAENLPWTFVEAAYIPELGEEDDTVDGGQLRGSIGFLGRGHAQAEWTDGDIGDESFDGYRLTVGGHNNITDNTQVIADLTYSDYEIDSNNNVDSIGLGLGLRRTVGPKAEVLAEVWYLDGDQTAFGDSEDFNQTFVELGGRYNWTRNISTGVTAFLGGTFVSGEAFSDNLIRVDARWSFGNNSVSDLN
jgi:opacity protein-like surface antigen